VFDIVEKSSTFLLEIITLVSSTNKMGADKVFIVGGMSLIQIIKSKLTPGDLHVITVPHFVENLSNHFISVFFFLSICQIGSEPIN
jgi:hypothetical protein